MMYKNGVVIMELDLKMIRCMLWNIQNKMIGLLNIGLILSMGYHYPIGLIII